MSTEAVIKVEGLYKHYKDVKAVDGISFEVFEGEIFGIVGPNGAGKTTAVECIEGLRVPDKGTIKVLGLDPQRDGKKLRQRVGIQLQEGRLPDRMRVWEALELFASFYSRPKPWPPILEELGLSEKRGAYFETLSGGQKQRLYIAISLVSDPEIVYLDELTTGLDPQARRAMWGLVQSIRHKGKTVVLITHFMEEAERLCDRVAIVDKGNIIALDTPANLARGLDTGFQILFSVAETSIKMELEKASSVIRIEQDREQFVVHGRDNRAIIEVVNILTQNNIRFSDFSVKQSNLEDVFLSLTGERMRD
ncbi:MAG: Daunorubicin/doxorubicin resistance ATP-binding protein DrrA [Dehalococcoidia bacterium]|nr:Daunorubicin/doxorubicin resistance ATP-binding protein DrrA [Chloroflexota bacterium]